MSIFVLHAGRLRLARSWPRLAACTCAGLLLGFPPLAWASVDWQAGTGFRSANLEVPASGKTGFTEMPAGTTGITFTNHLSKEAVAANQILLNGSGVAAGDVDGDGWCDLYFCRLEGPNVLYRNLGNWRFEDITAAAGVACADQYSTGAVFADIDGDGDLDLLVNSVGGGTRCFFNDGQGHFTEATDSGLVRKFGSMSMALADIDGDGDLDLYVANYRTTTVRSTGFDILNVDGRRMLKPEDRDRLYITPDGFLREYGEVSVVYLNDGKGHFQPLPWTDGRFRDEQGKPLAEPPKDWSQSVMFRDLNQDGAPDIYVCNDFWTPDRIWLNDGKGHFRAIAREALPNTCALSMSVDFADINRDGLDDFLVLDMYSPDHVRRMTQAVMFGLTPWPMGYSAERPQVSRNTLFLNRGDGTYAEIAQLSGLHATDWSWCPIFLDVDLDGYEDLLVAVGNLYDTQDQDAEGRITAMRPWPRAKSPFKLWLYPPLRLPRMAFRNRGDLTFEEVGQAWGFNATGVSHGMCLADLDNDGDLDVVVNNLNAAAGLYRSDSTKPRVAVRLKGSAANTRGIGSRIRLQGGAVPWQSQEMICGGRYLSCDDTLRVFAAGTLTNQMRIEVRWRSGKRSVVEAVRANRIYEIVEADTQWATPEAKTENQPVFEDVSSLIIHLHHQEPFDDFARQPLLPNKLSQLGPGVAWFDVDGDGWEDLLIASGRGGHLAAYRNNGKGGFSPMELPPLLAPVTRSQSSILGWRKSEGHTVLLAGSSNYEDGLGVGASVRQYDLEDKRIDDSLHGSESSTGPLALADIDGDGDLDLLVGGRVVPGRYPEPASSRLFRNDQGVFRLDTANSKLLEEVGLVSGAVFSDLDGDGDPDLVLACEWGPVRVFRNDGSQFVEITEHLGLGQFKGWWNGVTVGDFDGDGRLDIVASNWGRNTKYESHRSQPLRLYYGDLNGAGSVEIVEAYFDKTLAKLVPERAFMSMANGLPFIRERFTTHLAYGQASLAEILGERLKTTRELSANTLESMLFLNRGDHFEARPLPLEAQMAPAFAVTTGDFDGDGNEDVFLSQNFFAVQPETSPYDSGRGLWLRGDGRGNLAAVPGQVSGVKVYGEQRGAALADYDGDGRVDLVVTQNAGPTRLYHNVGAKPGLRVRLRAGPGNPDAIGATLRLLSGQRRGPAREIHAGSGYWSQDSAVQVLGASEPPTQIWVRWPGGKTTSSDIPNGAKGIEVDVSGKVTVVK